MKTWREYNTLKELERLTEFSNIRKSKTGLPVNIWVDEAGSYIRGKHAPRIKFQINKADRFQDGETASMTFNGKIEGPKNYEKKKEISSSDENKIRQFVFNNEPSLRALAKELIYKEDFDYIMIPGYEEMTEEEKKKLLINLDILINARKENHLDLDYENLLI